MTSVVLPKPRTVSLVNGDEPSGTMLEQLMVFLAGLMLPAISLSRTGVSASGLISRITPVDVIVCAAILTIMARGRRLRWDGPALAYLAVLVFAMGKGLTMAQNRQESMFPVTGFIALSMALAYWILGASIARSRELVRAIIFGVMCGVAWEGIIVLHDYILPGSKWFVDRAEMRVRGTFRKSGQLAAYGFSVTGILVCFGWLFWKRPFTRLFGLATACLGPFFVFAASRRSGIAAVVIWLIAYLILGMRHAPKRLYAWLVVLVMAGVIALAKNWESFMESYAGQRIMMAVYIVESGSNIMHRQFENAIDNLAMWFPLGTGVGMGHLAVVPGGDVFSATFVNEIHNGHLAVLVELGVMGSLAFYWMVCRAATRWWTSDLGAGTPIVRSVLVTFLLAAVVFAVHNRLHRDRGFMLFLGLACHFTCTVAQTGRSSMPVPSRYLVAVPSARRW